MYSEVVIFVIFSTKPVEIALFSVWGFGNKKSTELVEIRCFRFALPQGLEPWTL